MRDRVSSHSIGSLNVGLAKPGPAARVRGLLWYSSYVFQATSTNLGDLPFDSGFFFETPRGQYGGTAPYFQ